MQPGALRYNSGSHDSAVLLRTQLTYSAAQALGHDATDYNRSYTARSFVPYYAQRMSNAIVINGAQGILNGINKMRRDRLRRSSQA